MFNRYRSFNSFLNEFNYSTISKHKKIRNHNPCGYWNNEENVFKFLNVIKEKYNLQTANDWNSITRKKIQESGGGSLFNKYSIYKLKCLGFPEGKLYYNAEFKSSKYWEKKENVLLFLKNLQDHYNLKTSKDWNSINSQQIKSFGGYKLLKKYSLFDLKCMGFPDGSLEFDRAPKPEGYWKNEENVKKFLMQIKENLNLKNSKDWDLLTQKQIQLYGGSSLFNNYSLLDLKCLGFPEGKSSFKQKPKPAGFWDDEANVIKFTKILSEKYNLITFEDWNSLTKRQIQATGGSRLFSKYSLYDIKCLGFPDGKFSFNYTLKSPKPKGYWNNESNVQKFLLFLKEKLKLNSIEDWNRLSNEQIRMYGGDGLTKLFSLKELVQKQNFTSSDDISLSFHNKRSSQRLLFLQIQKIFPHEEIVEDYYHSEISRLTGYAVQFDIFLINRNIAFEYHGKQHYEDIPASGFSAIELYKQRDDEKIKLCEQCGIKLIIIPYWWDNQLDSLKNKIESVTM